MERISKAQIKLVRSLQQKKFRDESGLFVAEGAKCVDELRKSFELVHLYREGENATRTEIEQMSGLRTPQGVVGVFKKKSYSEAVLQQSGLTVRRTVLSSLSTASRIRVISARSYVPAIGSGCTISSVPSIPPTAIIQRSYKRRWVH